MDPGGIDLVLPLGDPADDLFLHQAGAQLRLGLPQEDTLVLAALELAPLPQTWDPLVHRTEVPLPAS